MATPSEVIVMLETLSNSGLDFTPTDSSNLIDIWVRIFADVPGPIFQVAVSDYLLTETRWPAPAKIRQLAERVKQHNGVSAAPSSFKPPVAELKIIWTVEPAERVAYPKELDALLVTDYEKWTRTDHALYSRVTGGPLFSQVSDEFWLSLQGQLCTV